jgi:hypothetical protein
MNSLDHIYQSNTYGPFKLTGFRIGYYKYEIEFIETGYKYIAQIGDIRKGIVRDYWAKTIAGVGFIGAKSSSRGRFYSTWCSMLHRCYDPTHVEYKRYGARGIYVCQEWHNYVIFEKDIVRVEGYDAELYNKRMISLDKDKKGKNYYGLDSCCFLSLADQLKYSRKTKDFIAEKEGLQVQGRSIRAFAQKYGLHHPNIIECLAGRIKQSKGWTFKYV